MQLCAKDLISGARIIPRDYALEETCTLVLESTCSILPVSLTISFQIQLLFKNNIVKHNNQIV